MSFAKVEIFLSLPHPSLIPPVTLFYLPRISPFILSSTTQTKMGSLRIPQTAFRKPHAGQREGWGRDEGGITGEMKATNLYNTIVYVKLRERWTTFCTILLFAWIFFLQSQSSCCEVKRSGLKEIVPRWKPSGPTLGLNYVLCGCRTLSRICNPVAQNISICNAKGYFFGLKILIFLAVGLQIRPSVRKQKMATAQYKIIHHSTAVVVGTCRCLWDSSDVYDERFNFVSCAVIIFQSIIRESLIQKVLSVLP